MAKIGLTSLYYAKLTEATDGTPSYDGAKTLGKAVSANVSITNNSATLYADDVLVESDSSFQTGTITLGTDEDSDTVFADLLGHQITSGNDGGVVTKSANDVAPYVAVGRVITKMVSGVRFYKAELLYKVKFSEPSQDDQTKGESLEFRTPEIEGTISCLANGKWATAKTFSSKADAVSFITTAIASTTQGAG